jgi:hypothetical protein
VRHALSRPTARCVPAAIGLAVIALAGIAPGSAWPQSKPVAAPQLGRLFYTPEQRREFDRRRQLNIQDIIVVNQGSYTVNGRVTRSSGRTTTWINGTPEHDAYRSPNAAVVPITPGEGEPRVSLKVGQTFDKSRDAIIDNLEGGSVAVNRGTAPRR